MIERQQSGGSRQRAWDLLIQREFETTKALAEAIGCAPEGLRGYIAALEKRGYIRRGPDGSISLVRQTGARSPSWSVHTDSFRDWNIDPAMSGRELTALFQASGLTVTGWCTAAGFVPQLSTRFRQMMNGQRPVSPAFADAARRLASA